MSAGQFRFALVDTATNRVVSTATNDANGLITFPSIPYTAAGTYNYIIMECGLATDAAWTAGAAPGTTSGPRNGWTFDTSQRAVTVTVTGTTALSASASYAGGSAGFTNTYTSGRGSAEIVGTKAIVGDNPPTETFTFDIVQTNGSYSASTTVTGAGSFRFYLSGLAPGTYTYPLRLLLLRLFL